MTPMEIRKTYFNTEADKLAIIGSAPSSIRLAPYGNPEWAVIGCSPGVYGIAPRSEAWVEIHRYEPGQPWFSPEYCQFLANYPGPVWMAEKRAEIPNAVEMPLTEMVRRFSPYFFTSSIAFMMALAIMAEFKVIGLFGVDMAAASEYKDQRLGCQFFALIAKARGIEVGVPPESDLLRPAPLYGVSEVSHARIKTLARRRELEGRIAMALQAQQNAKDETLFLRGALEDLEWVEMDWFGNVDGPSSRFLEPPLAVDLQQFSINLSAAAEAEMTKAAVDLAAYGSAAVHVEGAPNDLGAVVSRVKEWGTPYRRPKAAEFGGHTEDGETEATAPSTFSVPMKGVDYSMDEVTASSSPMTATEVEELRGSYPFPVGEPSE